MKKITLFLIVLFISISLSGQTKLSDSESKVVIEKIEKSGFGMESIHCDFVQTKKMKLLKKEMVSKGVMYFQHPNKLRWQYTSPYEYIFLLNGDKVDLKSAKSSQSIDIKENKMFRQIAVIVLGSVTATNLMGNADFNVEIYKDANSYYAKLYPKKKEFKQIYNTITIFFKSDLSMVTNVKMEEKSGDITDVKLSNVKLNIPIGEKVFTLN